MERLSMICTGPGQWVWVQFPGGGNALRMGHLNPELTHCVKVCLEDAETIASLPHK